MSVLDGQVALVTGGSRGIGRAISLELAREGAAVCVNYRKRAEDAQRIVAEIRAHRGQAAAIQADVGSEPEMHPLLGSIIQAFGRLDIVVCNAGIVRDQLIGAMSVQFWDDVIQT